MAEATDASVLVDLTVDDDSLSELSDAADPVASTTSSKAKSKSNQASVGLKKSASSSNLAGTKAKATTKTEARKSEPTPASKANGQTGSTPAKGKGKEDGIVAKLPHVSSTPISDAIRARTHVNADGSVQKKCHQHHQNCKGPLLECTFIRAPGKRCQGRYCFSSLKRLYDQDPETIVKSNRMMINPEEHCPPSEAKYAWKCPRCRGKCACSVCRKAVGLEPLGRWKTGRPGSSSSSTTVNGEAKSERSKSTTKANGDGQQKATPAQASKKATTKGKGKNIAEAVAAGKKSGKGKAKADAIDVDADQEDGVSTPPPPSSKTGTKKTLASILSTNMTRAPASKALKPPAETAPPTLELISTKLPEDNMRARMWIYESMVRFDKFGLNRSVLSQLDRFEHWTHTMVQDMLACLIKTIAGMSSIERGQPTKPFVKAVTALRSHGKDLQRGEPWAAATELLSILGLARAPLAFVEHDIPVEVEAAAAHRSPSPPPAARVTRARRAKEGNQYEIARQLSLLDQWEEDEFGETAGDGADDDEDDVLPAKRKRAATKKSMYVYDDPSDDDSMADPDDSSRARRSGRKRRTDEKASMPEVRLTGRQQAIRLQQEQQKEEEAVAATKQREEEQAGASRKRGASNGSVINGTASVASEDEDAIVQGRANGRSHSKKRKLVAGSSDEEVDSDDDGDNARQEKADVETKSNGATDEKDESMIEQEQQDLESPDLETKVSILSALINAAVMAESVAEELKLAADQVVSLDRAHKVANLEMEREIIEEMAELNKRAPSIVSPEYQKWKADKAALEQDHAWRRQDARVTGELAIDVHALRPGPLGHDADGREYWHLREYQERMPKTTEGRYAWCVVALGPAFPVDPNQPQEAEKDKMDVSMVEGGHSSKDKGVIQAKDEADDSGLTSLDTSTDNDKAEAEGEAEEVKLGLPTSKAHANGQVEAISETRVCMGTNDASTIKALINYISFRLERVEYEENVALQDREKLARAAKEDDDSEAAPSMYSIRKAKQTLKDTHEERRRQVEQLTERLTRSKEYFAWHREELAP